MNQSVIRPNIITPVLSQYASLITSPDLHDATMALPAAVHEPASFVYLLETELPTRGRQYILMGHSYHQLTDL